MKTHVSGFPGIGAAPELQSFADRYIAGDIGIADLQAAGRAWRLSRWRRQADAGLDFVTVGASGFVDILLEQTIRLGAVCLRFDPDSAGSDLDLAFRMARGRSARGAAAAPCRSAAWAGSLHVCVAPEVVSRQVFRLNAEPLFTEVRDALAFGYQPKVVMPGPLTWLWLADAPEGAFDKLSLLERLVAAYGQLLDGLVALGVRWVQFDEPILGQDLPFPWQQAFEGGYHRLQRRDINLLVSAGAGPFTGRLAALAGLPVAGVHIDLAPRSDEWWRVLDRHAPYKVLSLGLVDGMRGLAADDGIPSVLREVRARLGDRLWLASSASGEDSLAGFLSARAALSRQDAPVHA